MTTETTPYLVAFPDGTTEDVSMVRMHLDAVNYAKVYSASHADWHPHAFRLKVDLKSTAIKGARGPFPMQWAQVAKTPEEKILPFVVLENSIEPRQQGYDIGEMTVREVTCPPYPSPDSMRWGPKSLDVIIEIQQAFSQPVRDEIARLIGDISSASWLQAAGLAEHHGCDKFARAVREIVAVVDNWEGWSRN